MASLAKKLALNLAMNLATPLAGGENVVGPDDIAGLKLYVDPGHNVSPGATFTITDRKSGRVFEQSTAAAQPAHAAIDAVLGSQASLTFDGGDHLDDLGDPSFYNFMHSGPSTVFEVFRSTTALASVCTIISTGNPDAVTSSRGYTSRGIGLQISNGTAAIFSGDELAASITTNVNNWKCVAWDGRIGESAIEATCTTRTTWRLNNTTAVSIDTGNPASGMRIGKSAVAGSRQLTGKLGLVLVYNRFLSQAERHTIINWIISKFGLNEPLWSPVIPFEEVRFSGTLRNGALVGRNIISGNGTAVIAGRVSEDSGWTGVSIDVYRNGVYETQVTGSVVDRDFSVNVPILSELAYRDLVVSMTKPGSSKVFRTYSDIVAGDVYIVDGQSNGNDSTSTPNESNAEDSPWVRSFSTRSNIVTAIVNDDDWHYADGDGELTAGAIGRWPLRCFHQLALSTGIPMAVFNQAIDGQPIQNMTRNVLNPADTSQGFGRLYNRLERVGLRQSVRAAFFYQGEANQAQSATYLASFTTRHDWYYLDYPNMEKFYAFQVRSDSLGITTTAIPDIQRRYPETLPDVTVISTNGNNGHNGLHYDLAGSYWIGDNVKRLLQRDLYGATPVPDTEAVNVASATLAGNDITIVTSGDFSALTMDPGLLLSAWSVDAGRTIASIAMAGNNIVVTLNAGAGTPTRVKFLGPYGPGANAWIKNANGIGLLSFDLAIT